MSSKLGCLMTPLVLGEQEYCRCCSLCCCLLTVSHIGARPRRRHRHLRRRVMAPTLLDHEAEPLIVDALHPRCLVLAQLYEHRP